MNRTEKHQTPRREGPPSSGVDWLMMVSVERAETIRGQACKAILRDSSTVHALAVLLSQTFHCFSVQELHIEVTFIEL
jgi:hypothetical protein